ncbi:hypothetical protein LguiB_010633 [Lonicera macranthoides]
MERVKIKQYSSEKHGFLPNVAIGELVKMIVERVMLELKKNYTHVPDNLVEVDDIEKYPGYKKDDCNFYPFDGINVLVPKSLANVGDDNRFRMHDQIRGLDRQIVREANLNDPGNCSSLWGCEDSLEILQRHMGPKNVEAFYLGLESGPRYRSRCLVGEDFWQLQNHLRFPKMGYALIDGDFKHTFTPQEPSKIQGGGSSNVQSRLVMGFGSGKTYTCGLLKDRENPREEIV